MYVSTRGLGDAVSATRNVQIGGSLAASGASAVLGSIAASGGSVLGLTGAALSAAVPIIGAGLAAATMLVQYLVANSGCGQTCIVTSEWANKAADALQQVMDGYFALPAPRTEAQQALAKANFKTIWDQLVAACSQAGTGDAGKRCISDRQAGACTWRQKYAPVYPGQPQVGECWNWFNGYLGPIEADHVVPDPSPADEVSGAVSGAVDSILGGDESKLFPALLVGGLLLAAVAI
jgi:hypothetical protein